MQARTHRLACLALGAGTQDGRWPPHVEHHREPVAWYECKDRPDFVDYHETLREAVELEHAAEIRERRCYSSRSSSLVQSLCDRAIWLDRGELVMAGDVLPVIEAYSGRSPAAV